MSSYFYYDSTAVDYLKKKDKRLGSVIDQVGHIYRPAEDDLFASVIHHIIGQQISSKAQATVWQRMNEGLGTVSAETVSAAGADRIQAFGTTFRKAEYIYRFAEKVKKGEFSPDAVRTMSDSDAAAALTALDGIGMWTAEMILLFCLQRQDVLSWGDLGIRRGLRMVYRRRSISREDFEKYRRRYSPCGSVASLYLWAASCGAVPGLKDPAAEETKHGAGRRKTAPSAG
ncbi:MAG: DNA-3-methyladenine glycosylase family protein [Pyramidobacter sp.]